MNLKSKFWKNEKLHVGKLLFMKMIKWEANDINLVSSENQ